MAPSTGTASAALVRKDSLIATYVAITAQALLAGVFAWSVLGKVRSRAAFRDYQESAAALSRLPASWLVPVSVATAAVEVVLVVLLVVPATRVVALLLAAGLLLVFSVAIGQALRRGHQGSCRCFGPSRAPLGRRHLVRNLLLLGVAGAAAIAGPPGPTTVAGLAVALAVAVVGVLLVAAFAELVDLFRPPSHPQESLPWSRSLSSLSPPSRPSRR